MSLSATLVLGIGPIIGKALLKILLDDHPLLKELAPDLLDWLKDQAKDEHKQRGGTQQIGAAVAARLRPIIDGAQLADHELAAMLGEFMLTLNRVDAEQLVNARLISARLERGMFEARPEATKALSAKETQLYEKLVHAASVYVTAIASEFVGFNNLRDATILQDQERMLNAIFKLVEQPTQASATFEKQYRKIIRDELNKLEMFGVPRLKDIMDRQPLDIAYVTVEVERSRAPRSDLPEHALLEALLRDDDGLGHIDPGKRLAGPINTVLARERRIIVRGEAGSGKTTLLRWLAVNVAGGEFEGALSLWNNTIPFYIRLRKVDASGFPTPEQYVAQIDIDNAARQPTDDWAHQQLDAGRAVMLIDGIDELPKDRREAFLERLQRLVRNYPNARYVITSRPAATSKDNWPEWFEWSNAAGFAEVMIKPMDNGAIDAFIDHWHTAYAAGSLLTKRAGITQSAQHLKRLLPQRAPLHKLANNPLLCSMICALHHDRQHNLPSERLKLYEECVDMMLEQRDTGRKIDPKDYPALGSRQKRALLQELAYRMMRNGEIELSTDLVDKLFAEFLPQFGANPADAADVRDYFVERSSLLREPVLGQIDFMHRTFQEYFAAQAIADDGEVGYLFQQASNEQWRDTFPLAAGMLRPREVDDLLQRLIADNAPLPQRALAVACLETTVKVDPALRQRVFAAVPELFPSYLPASQQMLAAAGEHAIPYLLRESQPNIAAMVVCIRTLALIGGEKALAAIEGYHDVDSDAVRSDIDDAWVSFDHAEYARRLLKERLDISIDDSSLMPMLAEMPQLQSLNLSGTQVSDLSSLAHLPLLQTLYLSFTQVRDLSSLAHLPLLQSLYLSGTQVSDLSSLSHLPLLQSLYLRSTQVSDLSSLPHLPQLQSLDLSNTQVSDLSSLPHLPQLQSLDLSNTQVSDLSSLPHLPQLHMLNLNRTQVSDLSSLAHLPQLQSLNLSWTQVRDLSSLAHLPQLQSLSLISTQVSDLSSLPHLPQLQLLSLSNTQVSDLSSMPHLPRLQSLYLTGTQVSDLSSMPHLPRLQSLYLSNTQVSDLSSLPHLPQLQSLYLSGTQVSDLSSLALLPRLHTLDLSRTQVSDLSSLGHLPRLHTLYLSRTQVSDLRVLALLPHLEELYVS